MTVHALLREQGVCESGILRMERRRVHASSQIEVTPTQTQAKIRSIHSSSVRKDVRKRAFRSEFAVTLRFRTPLD